MHEKSSSWQVGVRHPYLMKKVLRLCCVSASTTTRVRHPYLMKKVLRNMPRLSFGPVAVRLQPEVEALAGGDSPHIQENSALPAHLTG